MHRKILCLVMAVSLMFGMTACKKNKNEKDAQAGSFVYVEKELGQINDLGAPGSMVLNPQGQPVIQNTTAEKPEFLVMGSDGKPERKIGCDVEGIVSAFTVDSNGNLYIAAAMADDENKVKQYIHIADSDGNVKRSIEVDSISQQIKEDINKAITGIAVDNEGNIILSRSQDSILVIGNDGKGKGTLGEAIFRGTAQADAENNAILYGIRLSDYKNILQKFNPDTGKNLWTTTFEPRREEGLSMRETNVIRCDPNDGSIYLLTGDGIEKFEANGNHTGKLLDFKEHTVLASGLQPKDFCVDSEGNIWLLTMESRLSSIPGAQENPGYLPKYSLYRYSLNQINDSDITPITLSVPSSSRLIEVAASKFNKDNPGYKISIKEAGVKKGKATYDEKYVNTLNTELMSGLGPDIISVAPLPYEKYISKNVLADLTGMMESDKQFRSEDYYGNIFDAMKTDGRLYAMPVCILINALLSNKKLIEDRGIIFDHATWTWDDFNEIANNASVGSGVYTIPPNTGYVLLSGSYRRFIDMHRKTAEFDSGEFEKMLDMAKRLGMDGSSFSSDGLDAMFDTAARGTVMFSPQVIDGFIAISTTKVLFGSDIAIHNMPGVDDEPRGGSFSPSEAFAINNNSRHREKAWEFVKILLSEEIQTMDEMKGFPVNKKALRIKADKNNELLTSKGISIVVSAGTGEPVTPEALTGQEISQLLEYVEGLETYCHMDNKVVEMIRNEAESFFAGKKTAAEAVKTIQNKVEIYLGE